MANADPMCSTIVEATTIADLPCDTIPRYHKQGQGGLPKPKAILARRPVWERAAIGEWVVNRRGPGRPSKP